METVKVISVALPLPLEKNFDYFVPKGLAVPTPFSRVIVEFNHKKLTGMITAIKNKRELPENIKPILKILDNGPLIKRKLDELVSWISEYYLVPAGQIYPYLYPFDNLHGFDAGEFSSKKFPPQKVYVELNKESNIRTVTGSRQIQFLQELEKFSGKVPLKNLPKISADSLQGLKNKGMINTSAEPVSPEEYVKGLEPVYKETVLSEEQNTIYNEIIELIRDTRHETFLLHGATGSGKTEIYLKLAEYAVGLGKRVLILVPEISLTPQLAGRFCAHFPGKVAIWHSALSLQQRIVLWKYIYYGLVNIVIGARSAIFAPMENIGLIVVDEEHELTYKQEEPDPRYHARDLAVVRGSLENCPVVLGSATPSLESYYNKSIGKYRYLPIKQRYGNAQPPIIKLVDLATERLDTQKPDLILSSTLCKQIDEVLTKGEQVILLLNRRGFSPIIFCAECGFTEKCRNCNISMTFHRTTNSLQCHYCGFHKAAPYRCPNCQGTEIIYYGWGTQHIEELLSSEFPDARVARMDLDSTRKTGSHGFLLREFASRKFDILLGTQMIAKGLDFPNVTLVGVIDADVGLHLPDFRSRERTFQLLYQVAGRSGRGSKRGTVILQTINPDDPGIKMAVQLNLKAFYNREMADRSALNYPPFSRMINIKFAGKDREKVSLTAKKVFNFLVTKKGRVRLIGPSPSPLQYLRGKYRFQLILKSGKKSDPSGKKLRTLVRELKNSEYFKKLPGNVTIKFDVDPVSLL